MPSGAPPWGTAGPLSPASFLLDPETMSSILSSMHADSIEVLKVCCLTEQGSQISASFMSSICPEFPLMPHIRPEPSAAACFARSSVSTRTTSAPQFYARVRGITSSALASALYGHWWIPSTVYAFSIILQASSISRAPPPGQRRGFTTTLRATPRASCKLRSISLRTSLLAPLSMIEQALGSSHSVMKVK